MNYTIFPIFFMVIKALCTGVSFSRLQFFFHSGESGSFSSANKFIFKVNAHLKM